MHARRGTLVAAVLALVIAGSSCRLPQVDEDTGAGQREALTSFLYAADGSLITRFHAEQDRVPVASHQIPQTIKDAVVAIEDRRFYEHRGIDLRAIVRAAYVNVSEGRLVEGGSTITQQYVKNTVAGRDRSLSRKLREALLAWRLERDLDKDEILTRYLNAVYFGRGAYGIQAAAKTYFSRPVWEVNLPQAAVLAGLIASPADFDPVEHPGAALNRRNEVLIQMLDLEMIDRATFDRATAAPIDVQLRPLTERYPAAYFVDHFKRWFLRNPEFGETFTQRYNLLFAGGLRIHTTLDPDLQRMAEDAVDQVLAYPTDPYGAVTVMNPRNGHVKAMVGGRDFFSTEDPVAQVNLATGDGGTGRPSGSAFKPFALVAALEHGIPPQQIYSAPRSITFALPLGSSPASWSPENYEGTGGGRMTLEQATIDSVNTVYAQLVRDLGGGDLFVGAQALVEVAQRMGVQSPLQAVPSAVLGVNPVTPLDMASAYGSLATGGLAHPPVIVSVIEGPDGTVLYESEDHPRSVVDPNVASVTNQILQKVVQEGTGAVANIGRPAFGKTGTGAHWRDAWFIGGIPQLVAAVWVGFPSGGVEMSAPAVRIPHVTGGSWPAQIWRVFMLNAARGLPVLEFPDPGVQYVSVSIDTSRGCVANPFTPPSLIRTMDFVAGTEPRDVCQEPTAYQELPVPSVIGLFVEQAERLLSGSGFDVSVLREPSSQPEGSVLRQTPGAGERALQASTIIITVAGPPAAP
jgi:penicillin-binding protein 1A